MTMSLLGKRADFKTEWPVKSQCIIHLNILYIYIYICTALIRSCLEYVYTYIVHYMCIYVCMYMICLEKRLEGYKQNVKSN